MKSLLFKPWGVKAIAAGVKTQTRRSIKIPKWWEGHLNYSKDCTQLISRDGGKLLYPVHLPGDIVYVKEPWCVYKSWDNYKPSELERGFTYKSVVFLNDLRVFNVVKKKEEWMGRTRSPLHLPEKLARYFLEVKSVRAERACDISEKDAHAEGVSFFTEIAFYRGVIYRDAFKDCWIEINGLESWGRWVWVYEFELIPQRAKEC